MQPCVGFAFGRKLIGGSSRAGLPPVQKRFFVSGDLKCNCNFHIIIKPCTHFTKVTFNPDGSKKRTSRPLWDDQYYVTIKIAETEHIGGCIPSPQQHVMQKSRSGRYISDISEMALFQLCNASHDGRMVNSQVSSLLHIHCSRCPFLSCYSSQYNF